AIDLRQQAAYTQVDGVAHAREAAEVTVEQQRREVAQEAARVLSRGRRQDVRRNERVAGAEADGVGGWRAGDGAGKVTGVGGGREASCSRHDVSPKRVGGGRSLIARGVNYGN